MEALAEHAGGLFGSVSQKFFAQVRVCQSQDSNG